MGNFERLFQNNVGEKLSEADLVEQKRIESYGRFLNLPSITGIPDEIWGEAVQGWRQGTLEGNMPPDLSSNEPPQGLKEFIEAKGYTFETGEKRSSEQ